MRDRAAVTRARDSESDDAVRPWRWRRGRAFGADASDILGVADRAAPASRSGSWAREPLEGFHRTFTVEEAFNRKSEARKMEFLAKEMVGNRATSRETLEELALAALIPAPSGTEAVATLEERLDGLNEALVALRIREKTRNEIVVGALDACGGAIRGFEGVVDELETRLSAGADADEDALNYVLSRSAAQLRYLRSQQTTTAKIALRVSVSEVITVSSSESHRSVATNEAPKPRSEALRQSRGFFTCCTSSSVDVGDCDVESLCAPSESAVSASEHWGESLRCVVSLTQGSDETESFASTSRDSSGITMIFNAVTPLMVADENAVLELNFYTCVDSIDQTDVETKATPNGRTQRALRAPGVLMTHYDDDETKGDKLRGRATIRVSELAETTRKHQPHELLISIEKPASGKSPRRSVGKATVFVDKLVETFNDESIAPMPVKGDTLQKAAEIFAAFEGTQTYNPRGIVHAFVNRLGACPAIAGLAEMFVLCRSWRFEVEYLERLSVCTADVVAAVSVGRLTTNEKRQYTELLELISRQLELELSNILPTASEAADELVLDMQATSTVVPAAVTLYALSLGDISMTRLALRLKRCVRDAMRRRCVEHMVRENPTKDSPTLTDIMAMIRNLTKRMSMDSMLLSRFPTEVEAMSEASVVVATFIQEVLTEVFQGIASMQNPPDYDSAIAELENLLSSHRNELKIRRLFAAQTFISSGFVDKLLQPAFEETLVSIHRELVVWVQQEIAKEKSSLQPLDEERGIMYSDSCAELFCTLVNINKSAQEHILQGQRASFNAGLLNRICHEILQTYVDAYEQKCLETVQDARSYLTQKARAKTHASTGVEHIEALMPAEFYTRLSNIHQMVLAIEPFMEEIPLLWCSSKVEFQEKLQQHVIETEIEDDQTPRFEEYNEDDVFEEDGKPFGTDITVNRIIHRLRTARANVIASLTELIEERVAPFVRIAILDSDARTRSTAVRIVFTMINSELQVMDTLLASGAFRLSLSSMHKAVCDSIEQLVLHRPIEEGSLESGERWKGSTMLTESQHSLVVELTSDVRTFFYSDGAGEPKSILNASEGRLQRLLNLWFTPTLEVEREFWHSKETLSREISMANGEAVRVRDVGGVSIQDILRFLRQRENDVTAMNLFNEQAKVTTTLTLRALFGSRLNSLDTLLGAWVCRNRCGLSGRLYVTSTQLAFSTSGVSIDHPHDGQTAMVREIRRITNIYRIDAQDGTSGLHVIFDDRRSFTFSQFGGVMTPLNVESRERDACVGLIRMNPSFLERQSYAKDVQPAQTIDTISMDASADELAQAAQNLQSPHLPDGESIITHCVCVRVNGLAREIGKFFVATESCVFLPVSGAGQGFTYTSMVQSNRKPELQMIGWRNADIILPIHDYLEAEPTMRLTGLTKIAATSVYNDLCDALTAYRGQNSTSRQLV